MIFIYGDVGNCPRRAPFLFNERNLNSDVSHRYVLDLVSKLSETGLVKDKKINNPRIPNEEAQIQVLGTFAADPTISLRSVAEQTGMSRETIRKTLKKHNFDPYKKGILHIEQ